MKAPTKLSSEERRTAIIKAVRGVFAEKGFEGTTTRELAEAAGVSEALLFKHFPTKESLFTAMQWSCCDEQDQGRFERLHALEPSASTLVLLVHFLVSRAVGGPHHEERAMHHRLILRSIAHDGEFARAMIRPLVERWVPKVVECLQAAVAAGEATPGPVVPDEAAWFAHHVAAMLLIHSLPTIPVVEHGVPHEQLVAQAVWFALRGIGLKEPVIKRNYNPSALALLEA